MFKLYTCLILTVLLFTGCINEDKFDQINSEVKLDLGVSIDQKADYTKSIISNTEFPASEAGEISDIGLFIMNEKGEPYKKGFDNLLAQLKGYISPDNTRHYIWNYRLNDGVTALDHLSVLPGSSFQLYAYYPRATSGTSKAVPFDITLPQNEGEQRDFMYSPLVSLNTTNTLQTQFVNLTFKHLFALIELQIKAQTGQQNMHISEVRIENRGNAQWIKNKGYFNPQSGTVSASSYGPIRILCNKTLTNVPDSYVKIQILVPPFINWNYQDGDIQVSFFSEKGQINPTAQLRLNSQQVTSMGFESGKKYAYRLSYNNNMFQIDDWFVNSEVTDNSIGK